MRISDWSSDVCSSDLLAAAGVGRVGVIDRAPVVLGEHAQARQLVDAGVDGGIVVISFLALELFRAERHVVVEVEVVAEGRDPGKAPAHAPLEGGNPLVGRARDGEERDGKSTRLNSSHSYA